MKPGEHPDFYRVAPPPGTSRESTIVLDREGHFWHDGVRVDHRPLAEAMHGWIARHPDDGRLILTNGYDWCYFRVEAAPYVVRSLSLEGPRSASADPSDAGRGSASAVPSVDAGRGSASAVPSGGGGVWLVLSDGTEERLDPATLSLDSGGVVYVQVKGGRFEASFSRHAQTQLAPLLTSGEPPRLRIADREYPFSSRADRAPADFA